jgi:hypothetical protein
MARAHAFNNSGGMNNSVSGNLTLNKGGRGGRGFGSRGIRNFGSNLFGVGGYGNLAYGNGYGGYGYGNRGYGSGGYGYRNSMYVRAYIPGIGWVMVPLRAIR